jgi:hypothetical protein
LYRLSDEGGDFEDSQPESVELSPSKLVGVLGSLQAELVHQPVSSGVQKKAEEVRAEAGARQAIGDERILEILDEIFTPTSNAIRRVDQLGWKAIKRGDHEQ